MVHGDEQRIKYRVALSLALSVALLFCEKREKRSITLRCSATEDASTQPSIREPDGQMRVTDAHTQAEKRALLNKG